MSSTAKYVDHTAVQRAQAMARALEMEPGRMARRRQIRPPRTVATVTTEVSTSRWGDPYPDPARRGRTGKPDQNRK